MSDRKNINKPKEIKKRSIPSIKKEFIELLLFIFRVRCLAVKLPLGTQSSHEVGLLEPSTL